MRRILTLSCLALVASALSPQLAAAGGNEFPGGGTRNLGRGGTGFTRADDPTVMLRNPALLSDLWEDMALSGLNILLPDACFQASGSLRVTSPNDVANYGDGPVLVAGAPKGSTTPDGKPLPDVLNEPLPNVCYTGPEPMLPHLALTMKLSPTVGVGLGFFPPDIASLPQWGNRDGTVDTPNGKRPSPSRWFRAHQNTSYFSALGAIGWRVADWLTIGAGFQWALVVYSATEFSRFSHVLGTADDVRTDVVGRDLFIPGVVASAQITPIDALDIAIGFKWSDRIKSVAKLDVYTNNFAYGQPFTFIDPDGDSRTVGSPVRTLNANRTGTVNAPPIWVPQLSLGLRFADRIVPRTTKANWGATHAAAGRHVEDHMATERWDIEADAIVYFNSANTVSRFYTSDLVKTGSVNSMGEPASLDALIGSCVIDVPDGEKCPTHVVPTYLHGKTQVSLRIGGDYNILPGVLSVRLGYSMETDGQDPKYLNITNYLLGRHGLHAGATLRVADKTDISIGFAHFIQKEVKLVREDGLLPIAKREPEKYHVVQGKNDGEASFAIADGTDSVEGPHFANAGSFYYHLEVVSVALAQHF